MKKGESMSLAVPAVALEVLGALVVVVVVVEVLGSGDEFFLAGNSVGMGRTWPKPLYERDGSLLVASVSMISCSVLTTAASPTGSRCITNSSSAIGVHSLLSFCSFSTRLKSIPPLTLYGGGVAPALSCFLATGGGGRLDVVARAVEVVVLAVVVAKRRGVVARGVEVVAGEAAGRSWIGGGGGGGTGGLAV